MPVATAKLEAERYSLKSLPAVGTEEEGFIVARPLPYGMKLERRDNATRMKMEQIVESATDRKKRSRSGEQETQKIELDIKSVWAAQHDFAFCIVDHNLTDVNGTKLDFSNPMAIKMLDPRVGSEIERILSDLNDDDDDEETMELFTKSQPSSSSSETTA